MGRVGSKYTWLKETEEERRLRLEDVLRGDGGGAGGYFGDDEAFRVRRLFALGLGFEPATPISLYSLCGKC